MRNFFTAPVRMLSDTKGAGSVLCLSLIAALLVFSGVMVSLSLALSGKHRIQAAAESAALAAADVLSGRVAGYPCELAQQAAEKNNTQLVSCEMEGLIATVAVGHDLLGTAFTVRARAGPP